MSPDPFPLLWVGSGDETMHVHMGHTFGLASVVVGGGLKRDEIEN